VKYGLPVRRPQMVTASSRPAALVIEESEVTINVTLLEVPLA